MPDALIAFPGVCVHLGTREDANCHTWALVFGTGTHHMCDLDQMSVLFSVSFFSSVKWGQYGSDTKSNRICRTVMFLKMKMHILTEILRHEVDLHDDGVARGSAQLGQADVVRAALRWV